MEHTGLVLLSAEFEPIPEGISYHSYRLFTSGRSEMRSHPQGGIGIQIRRGRRICTGDIRSGIEPLDHAVTGNIEERSEIRSYSESITTITGTGAEFRIRTGPCIVEVCGHTLQLPVLNLSWCCHISLRFPVLRSWSSRSIPGIVRTSKLPNGMIQHCEIIRHPLISHSLTILRDKDTPTETFRRHARLVSLILMTEATRHLRTSKKTIRTPLAGFEGRMLSQKLVVVPVLRAGLAMLDAIVDLVPSVAVGFVGLERNEETAIAREYYRKLPAMFSTRKVFILDPMLATGGSFDDTVRIVKDKNARDITLISIVSAPEGVSRITTTHPDVRIVTAAVDTHLNSRKYIVPGLGDFGDRYFGTV